MRARPACHSTVVNQKPRNGSSLARERSQCLAGMDLSFSNMQSYDLPMQKTPNEHIGVLPSLVAITLFLVFL